MYIGPFRHEQRASLIDLLVELGAYYDASGPPTAAQVARHLDESLAANGSPVTLVTAQEANGSVVGLAALVLMPSIVESVGPGRHQCQLKELFVSERARGAGVGEMLLRWSAQFAIERDCGRMDWNVKTDNAAGIRFYERHGARTVDNRLSYRIAGAELAALAR